MATCKDCVHGRLCAHYLKSASQLIHAPDGWVDEAIEEIIEHGEIDACKNFLNKADVAEVVRCKDCRYSHEGDDCYICRNPKGLPNEVFWFDFCSNGERRENNDE